MPEKSLSELKVKKNVYDQLKETEKESLSKKFQTQSQNVIKGIIYYSLPLVSIGIFIGMILFGAMPEIKKVLNYRKEITAKKEEIESLNNEISKLEELKANQYQIESDLEIIDRIVPSEKTQVAKFVGEVEILAEEFNLEESKYGSGEQIEKLGEEEIAQEEQSQDSAAIIQIPTESEYIAELENIKNFLNALYNKNDFIIVSELEMQGQSAREYLASLQKEKGEKVTVDLTLPELRWTMKVTFAKYQFSKGFGEYMSKNIVPATQEPDQITLEFIRSKYGKNE
jgi:hypothetical protein